MGFVVSLILFLGDLQAILDSSPVVKIPPGEYIGKYTLPSTLVDLDGTGVIIRGIVTDKGGTFKTESIRVAPVKAGAEYLSVSFEGIRVLMDNRPKSWSNWQNVYKNGEFLEGRGGRLVTPVIGDYPQGGELYELINSKPLTIKGLTVYTTDDMPYALQINGRVNVTLRDCTFKGSNWMTFDLNRCYRGLLSNVTVLCEKNPNNTTVSEYGICIHNCQNIDVIDCKSTALRHAITLAGDSNPQNIVNRFITIRGGTYRSYGVQPYEATQAIHTHGNSEYWRVIGTTSYGGIVGSGDKGEIIDNMIFGRNIGQASIPIYFAETNGSDFVIRGNAIDSIVVPGKSGAYGSIFVYLGQHTKRNGITRIEDNHLRIRGEAAPSIYTWNDSGTTTQVMMKDNLYGAQYPPKTQ